MLSAKKLSICFAEKQILKDINIQIKPGYITAILGHNGSGKSTLLKALAGSHIYQKHSNNTWQKTGTCQLNGLDIYSYDAKTLALQRAIFSQQISCNIPFTVYEFVQMGRFTADKTTTLFSKFFYRINTKYKKSIAKKEKNIVENSLSITNTNLLAKESILNISTGEFARVRLARALAQIWPEPKNIVKSQNTILQKSKLPQSLNTPRYLLLDEPMKALDLFNQHHIFSTLRLLTQQWNLGVLIATHDINLAMTYADNFILLKKGEIVKTGSEKKTMSSKILTKTFQYPMHIIQYKHNQCYQKILLSKKMIHPTSKKFLDVGNNQNSFNIKRSRIT